MNNLEKIRPDLKLENFFRTKGFQRKFKANELIFMENEREDCLFYIAEGLVKIFMISDEGKEKTLFILSSGQFFGEVSLFDGLGYDVNAEALGDTVIYSMNFKDLKNALFKEPDLSFDLLKVMAEKVRTLTQQIKDMVFYDISGRLANQILIFSKQFGKKTERGILIQLSLTHQELANLLGASRVTVTKTLNQFQEEGIIEIVNRRILITDLQQLMRYIG
ncbi:hypothetical protein BBF96_09380 [Anoxybacter fermentans]|uniref:Crp/Fnr family transcriptional regulator n=1 Tax=Anoxybacter fermentans TaxID=1323375 RepID=A0A3S9SZH5_9FIRM|nr:Crp/Fnr family transcriptional regulator [Anoxybacter fermentans]AZR73582.1 hypothetical protein BBF96_09380 [Anoxybacter fermentans]